MSNPYGEPKGGDFVAYIAEIERRQLAAMQRPHAPLTPAQAGAASAKSQSDRKALAADEARKLVARLRAGGHAFSAFDLIRLVVGFILLITGLFDDGGLIAIAIAAALLWGPVRRIVRLMGHARGTGSQAPKQVLDAVFSRDASGAGGQQKSQTKKT